MQAVSCLHHQRAPATSTCQKNLPTKQSQYCRRLSREIAQNERSLVWGETVDETTRLYFWLYYQQRRTSDTSTRSTMSYKRHICTINNVVQTTHLHDQQRRTNDISTRPTTVVRTTHLPDRRTNRNPSFWNETGSFSRARTQSVTSRLHFDVTPHSMPVSVPL